MKLVQSLALQIPQIRRIWEQRNQLLAARQHEAINPNHFFHYSASFDPTELIRRYAVHGQTPTPGMLTNFLGVMIPPELFPSILDSRGGTVEEIPIPSNWHADIAEWGSALLSVDRAHGSFRIVELGCGWGCWLNNMGAAARSRGLQIELIGIEGDADHIAAAEQILSINGFDQSQYKIIHGVAAPRRGTALFPVVASPGASWGSEPVLDASENQIAEARASGDYAVLDALPLEEIAGGKTINLLHIDIQGGETAFVRDNLAAISTHVKRVLIGTHSRKIEGDLVQLMTDQGWTMEMDRPAIVGLYADKPVTKVDGVHLYRNDRLEP